MMTIEGIVQRLGRGKGTWRLITRDGSSYELAQDAPPDLLRPDQRVTVKGRLHPKYPAMRDQALLEVVSFELLKP